MRDETYRLMTQSMGFTSQAVSPDSRVGKYSGGEKQGVAIVRALFFDAEIIILDEPTMGLSLKETAKLVNFVNGIKQAGKSAIFIDHNILHVYNVADRVVVIDRGRVAGEFYDQEYWRERINGKDGPCCRNRQPRLANDKDGTYENSNRRNHTCRSPSTIKCPSVFEDLPAANSAQLGILGVFLALWLIFIISAPSTFLTPQIYYCLHVLHPLLCHYGHSPDHRGDRQGDGSLVPIDYGHGHGGIFFYIQWDSLYW